ncbi:MAG: N-acetyltransferase [Alphaproteobacteria bacterium]|nr:N-acetyltransferase [Alphaproteobacteria bacterium]
MTTKITAISSLRDVSAADWDSCAGNDNPFVSHAFLLALEMSGSATAKTGWAGQHLILEDNGKIVGVVPCYLKTHSRGEYVFDHGWADAFTRAGGRYYPKLQVSVPFTPATGPRLLASTAEHRLALAEGLLTLCEQSKASSVHITFALDAEAQELQNAGWLLRNDIQFHWHNQGYLSFADFLAQLSSSKRKNIRKEREAVARGGITFEHVTGAALTEAHWDHFYAFYMDTGSRKWGDPYLTRKFFSLINQTMPEKTLLVMAKREGRTIAGALNFIGKDTLFGRNWGCTENHPFLHFETCYYQAMDFAISRGLAKVEAGAQGEHKLARGYLPEKTNSLHHLAHPGLARAVADYLEQERAAIAQDQDVLGQHSPFRHEEQD